MKPLPETDRAKLIAAAEIMEGLAKDKLADVSVLRSKEIEHANAISAMVFKIAKIRKQSQDLPDQLKAEARKARFLYDQACALRQQADTIRVPNYWLVQADELLRASSSALTHRLENASYSKALLTIDVFFVGDDMKIASIVCHDPHIADQPLFSVAGYRNKMGSPNTPFTTLSEALDCALAMQRWDADDDKMFISSTATGENVNGDPHLYRDALGRVGPGPHQERQ